MDKILIVVVGICAIIFLVFLWHVMSDLKRPRYIKKKKFFRMVNGESFLSTVGNRPLEIEHLYSSAEKMFIATNGE